MPDGNEKSDFVGKLVINRQDTDVSKVADEIIRYLDAHENAADTLEGVAQWWISRQRIQEALEQVQKALDFLCEEGIVKATPVVGGKILYSLNKEALNKLPSGN